MKKRYILQSALYLFVLPLLFLWGCGGSGPGGPGSQGTESTGLMVDVSLVPTYLNTDGVYNVDVHQISDCDGDVSTNDPETFTDHGAVLTLTARWLNPNATFTPGYLYIEKYTIEYRRSEDSIGAPPIVQDTRYKSITITPSATGSDTSQVIDSAIFVDLPRKTKYYTDATSGQYSSHPAYINNYTATYIFEGQNQYGVRFTLTSQVPFSMGSYDNCQ